MDATFRSFEHLASVRPELSRIAPARDLIAGFRDGLLLHAGPAFADPVDLPQPVFNSVVAAARLEGWAETAADVARALADGSLSLAPAQDFGLVTPLAFVVSPSMYCLEMRDAANPSQARFSPLNDGPPALSFRFGAGGADAFSFLRMITEQAGPALSTALTTPVPILPIMADALAKGDDLHGRVEAAQAHVAGLFQGNLSQAAMDYLTKANQFMLNVIMATAALMIGSGAGIAGSRMVMAAGGNGRDCGYKLAEAPDRWITRPASPPIGPKMPDHAARNALPAIGDSAVIDALGLGAACLRFAPERARVLTPFVDAAFFTDAAHAPFLGPHPALGNDAIHLGLDLSRPRDCLGINLGMVEEKGEIGLIGRGVAPWPAD